MTARDRTILIVLAAVAAVVGCWMLVVSPERKHAAALTAQVHTLQGQLATAQSQLTKGLAARSQFATDYTELARLGEALPQDENVPSLIYQLQNAASNSAVAFQTLQLVPGAGGSSTGSSSGGSATGSSSGGSSAASAATLPPGAAMGPAGFPTEEFTFTFNGDFFHLSEFFARLEKFVVASAHNVSVRGRLLTINAISLGPGAKGFPSITANVSATSYMAPATTGLLDGATPAGPAGTTAAPAAPGTGASAAPATITPSLR